MFAMNKHPLEPGLLATFQLYTVVRLLIVLIAAAFYFAWNEPALETRHLLYVVPFMVDVFFLAFFLSSPWFQRRLGQFFLPLALLIATVGPIVEMVYVLPLYVKDGALAFLLVFLILLVPLILTAWQYSFRYVVLFSLGTSWFEYFLLSTTSQLEAFGHIWGVVLLAGRSLLSIFVGYIVANLVAEQRKQRLELAEANRKLVRYASTLEELAVSRERNRLARELHDTLAHALSGLAVQLDAIATVWNPIPERASAMLERALSITRTGLNETRRALQALRATPLEDLGLVPAIRHMAESTAARDGLSLALDLPERIGTFSPEVEQCYYRVAQEALDNVTRHANARHVSLSLHQDDGGLTLEVSDDGLGFEDGAAAPEDHFGIKGMRERAELIGGHLEVQSRPKQGTTIRLSGGGAR
jgi:signal transduction histidine kinase